MLLDASSRMLLRNTLAVMPDVPAQSRRVTPLKVVGWVAYFLTLAVLAWFIILWIHNDVPKTDQLYPLPGIASALLIVGLWTIIGPALYKSRSTATRVGKYVLGVLLSILFYPIVVTGLSSFAAWIVSLVPGSPLH